VEKLAEAGVTTVEALADMTPEQLEAIEGIGPKTVEKISLAVNNYFASLEPGAEVQDVEGEALVEGEGAAAVSEATGEEVSLQAGAGEEAAAEESQEAGSEPEPATAHENNNEQAEETAPEADRASETRE